jgi:hypothetical protein
MTPALPAYRAVLFWLACGVACVDARGSDPLGNANFISSGSSVSRDYAAPASTAGVGAIAGAPALPLRGPAAGAGSAAPQPTPVVPAAMAGMPPTAAGGTAGRPSGAAGVAAITAAGAGAAAVAGAPAASGGRGGSTSPAPSSAGTLTANFTTVNQGGGYAPQNVGAVWIETAAGVFVKTLERWGNIRSNHLTRWNAASGGWGSLFGGGNTADMMDAVSRATLRSHGAHHDTWDMQDPLGTVVADGSYNLLIEVTEDNRRPGATAMIPFVKSAMPQSITPADTPPYAALTLSYQP